MEHTEQRNKWEANLCSCPPFGSCLLGTFLPCMLLGRTSARMNPSMQSHDGCNSDCLIFTAIQCFTGCGFVYSMMKRTEIRERYDIKGSCCGDCCVSFWCLCCALIQQDNEVKRRMEQQSNTLGYQSQGVMHMPTPLYQHPGQQPVQQDQGI